ncbi:MAG: transcription-repair coupling factor [Flavobacteriales bacterium]
MEAKALADIYSSSKIIATLKDELQQQKSPINLFGAKGSLPALIAAQIWKRRHTPHLFLLNDNEEAAYFYNDLQQFIPKEEVFFFPASYRNPYEVEEVQNANVLTRTEILSALAGSKNKIIISYPEAIAEKVVSEKVFKQHSLQIQKGEKLSTDFVIDVLFEYHFDRTDYVVEPGQFAVRGGIIDIFSYSNDYPFRVEFFGDEVESIRTFDPSNQLSVDPLNSITVVPDIMGKESVSARESLINFLGKDCLLWIFNASLFEEQVGKAFEKTVRLFEKTSESPIQKRIPEELFLTDASFREEIKKQQLIHFKNNGEGGIVVHSSPQLNFNKNFQLLVEHLKEYEDKGYSIYLASDNAKELNRLKEIIAHHPTVVPIKYDLLNVALHEGFIDHAEKIVCYTDHQIFNRYHRFKLKERYKKSKQAITIKELTGLHKGDFVVHTDYGIGVFDGLETIENDGKKHESVRILYKDSDLLYVNIQSLHKISRYSGKEGKEPAVNKLGTAAWKTKKENTKKKVKEVAYDLIKLYAKRKAQKGFAYSHDTYLQNELEASFIYEDTPDQEKATKAVKEDMEKNFPMDRLVCGDVGFGKTEIAIRAAFKAVCDSKQVAVLVPTTILALQHYRSFSERFKDLPCKVDYINRFRTAKQQKETLDQLKEGKVDVIIGTHRIVGKDVQFKDLGLLIIDEEQKFGVSIKDKLKLIKANVDTLTLTATPIPRTLQFSLMGARDLSVITTPPPNRYPVETTVTGFNDEMLRDAIRFELDRGGQVFFVHNKVGNIMEVAGKIQRLLPSARVAIGHGQMDGDKLEEVMLDFIEGQFDVLVATTIIESGLDIPNANTIIINNAQNFGLSDLHQMRGRVGRSNKKAFCYLLTPPLSTLSDESRKRLRALEEFSDLGSGFNIAMRDLDIRGAGDLLGAEQSGFITDVGYDMYQRILDEALHELKETEFKDLYEGEPNVRMFADECVIDTDVEILIPTNYVNTVSERLSLYKELNEVKNEEQLLAFEKHMIDRFGAIPKPTKELFNAMRLRWIGQKLGFEKIIIKNNKLSGHFLGDQSNKYFQSEQFGKTLKYIQDNPLKCQLKQVKNKLTMAMDYVTTIQEAKEALGKML